MNNITRNEIQRRQQSWGTRHPTLDSINAWKTYEKLKWNRLSTFSAFPFAHTNRSAFFSLHWHICRPIKCRILRINAKCQKFYTESYVFPGAHSPTLTLTHTHIHTRNTIDGSWFIGKLTTNKEWNGQRGILLAFHLKKIIWLLTFACVRCAPPSNTRRLPFDARIPMKSGTTFFINVNKCAGITQARAYRVSRCCWHARALLLFILCRTRKATDSFFYSLWYYLHLIAFTAISVCSVEYAWCPMPVGLSASLPMHNTYMQTRIPIVIDFISIYLNFSNHTARLLPAYSREQHQQRQRSTENNNLWISGVGQIENCLHVWTKNNIFFFNSRECEYVPQLLCTVHIFYDLYTCRTMWGLREKKKNTAILFIIT